MRVVLLWSPPLDWRAAKSCVPQLKEHEEKEVRVERNLSRARDASSASWNAGICGSTGAAQQARRRLHRADVGDMQRLLRGFAPPLLPGARRRQPRLLRVEPFLAPLPLGPGCVRRHQLEHAPLLVVATAASTAAGTDSASIGTARRRSGLARRRRASAASRQADVHSEHQPDPALAQRNRPH